MKVSLSAISRALAIPVEKIQAWIAQEGIPTDVCISLESAKFPLSLVPGYQAGEEDLYLPLQEAADRVDVPVNTISHWQKRKWIRSKRADVIVVNMADVKALVYLSRHRGNLRGVIKREGTQVFVSPTAIDALKD